MDPWYPCAMPFVGTISRLHPFLCAPEAMFSNQTWSHGIANLLMNLGVLLFRCCRRSMLCAHVRAAWICAPPTHQQDSNVESLICILGSYWHWYFADEVDRHNEHHPPTHHQQISNAMKFDRRPLRSLWAHKANRVHLGVNVMHLKWILLKYVLPGLNFIF